MKLSLHHNGRDIIKLGLSWIKKSKFLSLILRHRPDLIGVSMDNQGWVQVAELLDKAKRSGNCISEEELYEIVRTSDKQRFALSDDGLRIRANQGHSVKVDLNLKTVAPPEHLFHGTVQKFLPGILSDGLKKKNRHHVHLSETVETAIKVGERRGRPVLLRVSAYKMHSGGFKFYLSENRVWLTAYVPPSFLEVLDKRIQINTRKR